MMEFRRRLEALGWADGRNIRADYRWIGEVDRINDAAKEIVEQRPEVILAEATLAVAALSRESGAIPIVFVNVSDPIGSGFVASLSRPGGMITGFTSNEPTLGGKWPELLKEIAPNVRRIGLLFDPDTAPYADLFLHQAEAAARSLTIELFAARVHGRTEIERTMAALAGDSGSGLIVLPDPTTNSASELIIESAARHRIPAIYAWEFEVVAGGLMSYGMDLADSFRSAAVYVDRILRGNMPADLPVQAPTKFKFVLNMRTAKALGIEPPTVTLLRADELIE
jgi:putative tryptophan/tyrosine transport system substrate-binding protein